MYYIVTLFNILLCSSNNSKPDKSNTLLDSSSSHCLLGVLIMDATSSKTTKQKNNIFTITFINQNKNFNVQAFYTLPIAFTGSVLL